MLLVFRQEINAIQLQSQTTVSPHFTPNSIFVAIQGLFIQTK